MDMATYHLDRKQLSQSMGLPGLAMVTKCFFIGHIYILGALVDSLTVANSLQEVLI